MSDPPTGALHFTTVDGEPSLLILYLRPRLDRWLWQIARVITYVGCLFILLSFLGPFFFTTLFESLPHSWWVWGCLAVMFVLTPASCIWLLRRPQGAENLTRCNVRTLQIERTYASDRLNRLFGWCVRYEDEDGSSRSCRVENADPFRQAMEIEVSTLLNASM